MTVLNAFIEYWYLTVILVVAIVLTVFVSVKAAKAAKKSRSKREKIIEQLRYENKTRAEFANPTAQQILSAEPEKLVDGIALNLQADLEKQADMVAAFENLSKPPKYIYALYYFITDSKEKLSEFFKKNGKPLTGTAKEAVESALGCKVYDLYVKQYQAFDSENEDVSLIQTEIDASDAAFAEVRAETDFYELAAAYIKTNYVYFTAECEECD